MKFYISPGVIIMTMGMIGLLFAFVDTTGSIGGKIPLAMFFIFVTAIGVIYELYPRRNFENTYGEFERKEFG